MLQIFLSISALVACVLAVRLFVDSPIVAWASLLLLLFAAQATALFGGMAGAVHFYPGDALTILLLIAGVVRIAPVINRGGLSAMLALLFVAFVVFSLMRGLPEAGLTRAGNLSRNYLGISSSILYFSTFPANDSRLKKYVDIFVWYCGALVLLAAIRYAGLGGGFLSPSYDYRPIPAAGANAIAVGFLSCLCRRHYYASSKLVSWLTPVFGATAIVLQHRTVWVVLIAIMVSAFIADRSLGRKLIPMFVVAALLCGVVGVAIYGAEVNDQFETSATDTGTFLWRVEGWMALLGTDEQTPLTYAAGVPAGTKFAQNETLATAAGHSMYISALLHVGVLGLGVFLGLVLRPVVKLYGLRRMEGVLAFPDPVFWVVFLISLLFFGFTYTIGWDQAALIGIANSIVITRSCSEINKREQCVQVGESSMGLRGD